MVCGVNRLKKKNPPDLLKLNIKNKFMRENEERKKRERKKIKLTTTANVTGCDLVT